MAYRVMVRVGPRVKRHQADGLEHALDLLEAEGREAQQSADAREVDIVSRKFAPVMQVHARLELCEAPAGLLARLKPPKVLGGIDVRGDGSAEAYLGRVRRELLEQRSREDAFDALRRAILSGAAH